MKSPAGIALSSILLVFLAVSNAFAIKTEVEAHILSNILLIDARLTGGNGQEIANALQNGLKSEIVFQFRLYKKNLGFFSFAGDMFILEKKVSYVASCDFFDRQFIIRSGEKNLVFENAAEFLDQFFKLESFPVTLQEKIDPEDYTMLARITINPIKLDPPLHIVSLITRLGETTGWVETSIARFAQ